jgi:hypothetical protein
MYIASIDHVQLAMPAGREQDARSFYSGLLGLPEVPKPADLAKRGGAWLENGAPRFISVSSRFSAGAQGSSRNSRSRIE